MGYATAKVIAAADPKYHIILAGRSQERIDTAAKELLQTEHCKGQFSTLLLDVTDEASIASAVERVKADFGRLDVLINNAGISSHSPSLKVQLEECFKTNTIGPVLVTEAFVPLLLKSKAPYLVHISSVLGSASIAEDKSHFAYDTEYRAYRMSKAALDMTAIQDARLLGPRGVKVFTVCPGLVESNLRGTSAQARSAGGRAGSADVSGGTILKILEGARDADVSKFVHKDGIYAW